MYDAEYFLKLAKDIVAGYAVRESLKKSLLEISLQETFQLLPGADYIRRSFFGDEIHLCAIVNAKSGRCSEDCFFCAQSGYHSAEIETYPLLEARNILERAKQAAATPTNRFSLVTSGKGISSDDLERISQALEAMNQLPLSSCASLGILDDLQLNKLKQAGLSRYHHNLETAPSYFPHICSTHSYEDRLATVKKAQKAGLSVCCGGIFGLGESESQVLELAQTLQELRVEAVPVNFLTPVKGTPAQHLRELTPVKCLKIIAMLRYMLPDKEIIICGGRSQNLMDLQNMMFYAGASGIMTGDYLTTSGNTLEQDLRMLERLHLKVRAKSVAARHAVHLFS